MAPSAPVAETQWQAVRYAAVAGLMLGLVVLVLAGLETRRRTGLPEGVPGVFMVYGKAYVRPWAFPATLLAFGLCALGGWLLREPGNETERLYQQLFRWGTYWLVLGLLFEPYEGGIKKDHPTMSYYFVTAGLASCLLIGFSVLIDRFKRRRWFQLLIDNGQNPMIAYAGINNFIIPVLVLTGGMSALLWLDTTPWLAFLRGLIIILLMAITVSFLSWRKIFWRT
jgi:predicted acyltransferase